MSGDLLVQHCAPTLAGLKTGNMFTCCFEDVQELIEDVRLWNGVLVKKGLRMIPLRIKEHSALIYVFRPSHLEKDLNDSKASEILKACGYREENPQRCINHLIKRIGEIDGFPHEVGLFLGYPPEDVNGFIENKAQRCKCVGYWKVYGDEEKAQRLFAKYKKCTEVYWTCHQSGRSIEKLTVAG